MNLRYSPAVLEACRYLGFMIGRFNRGEEPEEITSREGASLEWGTERAIETLGEVPDVVYDEGGIGKEPMVRILGDDAQDICHKVLAIHRQLVKSRGG